MYKIVGIALVVLSSGLFTYLKVERMREQFLNLKEIKKAITYLKHELTFSGDKISGLCKKISDNTSGPIAQIFMDIAEMLDGENNIDIFSAWQSKTCDKQLFSKQTEKEISDFFKNFGKKSIEIELENIKKTEDTLQMLISEEGEKLIKDKKLIYTISAALCAVIVILAI